MSNRHSRRAALRGLAAVVVLCALPGCDRTNQETLNRTLSHAQHLVETAKHDAAEIRQGLPQGAEELAKHWADEPDPLTDPEAARRLLTRAHDKVQDLRVATSRFFAPATLDGHVVPTVRAQPHMEGRPLFPAIPDLA